MAGRVNGSWVGFLSITFMVVGLTGLFATVAAPLPLQRALLREAVLDEALGALHAPDPDAALAKLRPRLDDSAPVLDGTTADLPARIDAERAAMRARFETESASVTERLRWLIVIVTLAGALFGAIVLGSVARRA